MYIIKLIMNMISQPTLRLRHDASMTHPAKLARERV